MFWIIALLVVGGTYKAVDSMLTPAVVLAVVGGGVLGYGVIGLAAVDERTGLAAVMIRSWQVLGGIDTPQQITGPNCAHPTAWALPGILLALVLAFVGFVAIAGTPIGIVMTVGGGLMSLFSGDEDYVKPGLVVLIAGIGGVVAAGLMMRLLHVYYTDLVCPGT